MPQTIQTNLQATTAEATPKQKPRLPLNSFGFRLFAMIMGGALVSIASVAVLFAETAKFQAEEQIQKVLEGKVSTLNEVTDRAENLAYSLGVSVATLHDRGAETPQTYQALAERLFASHPSYVLGLGFGQKNYGILPNRQWFYPYYYIDSPIEEQEQLSPTEPMQTTAQTETVKYTDRASSEESYPISESYRQYFLPQKDVWRAPYQRDGNSLITFYSQIFSDRDEWLGTSVIDIDAAYLQALLNEPVFRQGGQLILLERNGRVIANPAQETSQETGQETITTNETYEDIPGLDEIWPQISAESNSGFIEGSSGYWSYIQIPEQSWVVLAYVPYSTVFGRIIAIALGATLLAGLLMTGLTALVIRYLNKSLRPVIDECQRLSVEDETVTARLKGKDELEQLSISFFNLLEQLQLTQTQIKLEAAHANEVETQLNQIKTRNIANSRRQRQVTRKLANILPTNLTNQPAINATNSSTQRIQQELSQLGQVISTLAADDWLLDTLESRNSDPAFAQNATDITQVNSRLSQTFLQILSALQQFSKLLFAFSKTQNHVLTIEQTMLSAQQKMQTQTQTIAQLHHWLENYEFLCHEIASHEMGHQTAQLTAAKPLPQAWQSEIELTAKEFRQTAERLNQQLRSLATVTNSIDQNHRQYQRINNAAQVLIMNASTLSISASRQQSPESFEKIVKQFQAKNAELQKLAQQLEGAQSQQQQSSEQVNTLVQTLTTNITTFQQAATQLDHLITTLQSSSSPTAPTTATTLQKTSQQLSQQLTSLRQSLQQIETTTTTTTQQINTTLQKTSQINQISETIPAALPPALQSPTAQS